MQIETPFGKAFARINDAGAVTHLGFGEGLENGTNSALARQLHEYFSGTRQVFDIPMQPEGTEFQKRVWAELARIPFGQTISYSELAARVGQPGAARAVGRANATNPVSLLVPCHRVIGLNGKPTGYAWGIELKEKLLQWERTVIRTSAACPETETAPRR